MQRFNGLFSGRPLLIIAVLVTAIGIAAGLLVALPVFAGQGNSASLGLGAATVAGAALVLAHVKFTKKTLRRNALRRSDLWPDESWGARE